MERKFVHLLTVTVSGTSVALSLDRGKKILQ